MLAFAGVSGTAAVFFNYDIRCLSLQPSGKDFGVRAGALNRNPTFERRSALEADLPR
jgi:hypothetical protein